MYILGKVCLLLLLEGFPNCISYRLHKSRLYSHVHKIEGKEKPYYEDFCIPFLLSIGFYLAH